MICYICNDKNNILSITNSIDVKIFTDSVSLCIADMSFPKNLTLKLCVHCYDSLTAFNRFRQLCIRNEDYMKEIFKVKPKKKRKKLSGSDDLPRVKTEPETHLSNEENVSTEPAPKLKKGKKRKSENQHEGGIPKKLKKSKVKDEPNDIPEKKTKNKKKVSKIEKTKSEQCDNASPKPKTQNKTKKRLRKNRRKESVKNGENSKNKKNLESKKKNSAKKSNKPQNEEIESDTRTENKVIENTDTNQENENATTVEQSECYYKSNSSNNGPYVCEKCNKVTFGLIDLRQHVVMKHFNDVHYVNRIISRNFFSYGRHSPGRSNRSIKYNRYSSERDSYNYRGSNYDQSRRSNRERSSEIREENNSIEQHHSNEEHYSNSEHQNEENDQLNIYNTLNFNSNTVKKENLSSNNTEEHYDAMKYTIFEDDLNDSSVIIESENYSENARQDSNIVNTKIEYIDLV